MSDYDVVIVGAGPSGAILARHLGAAGKKVLVLEAGGDTGKTWNEYQANVDQYHGSSVRVPNSPYYFSEFAPTANVLDITKIPPGGVDENGYLVQKGPLPFGSDYAPRQGRDDAALGGHQPPDGAERLPVEDEVPARCRLADRLRRPQTLLRPGRARVRRVGQRRGPGVLGHHVHPELRVPDAAAPVELQRPGDGEGAQQQDGAGRWRTAAGRRDEHAERANSIPNPKYNNGAGYEPVGAVANPHRGHRCEGNSSCIPICPVQAKYSALKTLAAVNANVTIITQAVVSKVLLSNDNEVVTGVQYSQYQDGMPPPFPTKTVTADIYVLAGNVIENPKLLLASGVPNKSGQIGLNLMDHPFLMRWGLMSQSVGAFRGRLRPRASR